MSQEKDFYRILGVSRTASEEEIKASYKKLVRKYHPDVNRNDKKAEEKFKEVAVAFEVLGDSKKKELYDEFGMAGVRSGFDPSHARNPFGGGGGGFDMSSLFEEMFGGGGGRGQRGGNPFGGGGGNPFGGGGGNPFGGGGDPFGGRGQRRGPSPIKGDEIETPFNLTFMEAVLGGKKDVTIQDYQGNTPTKVIQLNIPPGIDQDARIRLGKKGKPGQHGGQAGDQFLIPRIGRHDIFRRDGRNLHMDLPLNLLEAYQGTKVEIPTPTGSVTLRIPVSAQTGQKLRLRGKGIPAHKKNAVGDLYVIIQVMMPKQQNDELQEIFEKIESFYEAPLRENFGSIIEELKGTDESS